MSDLESFFREAADVVEASLDNLVPSIDLEPSRLHGAMRWSLFGGGKRFRPALLIAVGRAFGASDASLIRTASAVEMLHTYSLIHDDLPAMDDDDLRRGRETCHKKYGEATAILAGDALQAMAFQTIADDNNLTESTRLKLLSGIGSAAAKMVSGQHLDLESEGRKISMDEVRQIHENKTGALIAFSANAGAIIAETERRDADLIMEYAAVIGLLFQITDDLLDITQTTRILGKTAGKDVVSGKATYPAIYGIEAARRHANEIQIEATRLAEDIPGGREILAEIPGYLCDRVT